MEPRDLSRKKKVLFSSVTFCAVLLILEGVARLAVSPSDTSLHKIHQDIITILGLPELNEVMAYDDNLFWVLKKNVSGRRIQGTIKEKPIDFTVSTNSLGLRGPEVRAREKPLLILAVGNSCTFGVGVNDDKTWPARLEEVLSKRYGIPAEVLNAGVPGYTAYQGLRYLEERGLGLRPAMVIACFGFNDADAWGPKGDVDIAKSLSILRWDRLLSQSRFYVGLKGLIRGLGGPPPDPVEDRRARLLPEEYYETLMAMNRLCASRRIPLILVVWPYRNQKQEGVYDWIGYQPIVAQVSRDGRVPVVNLIEPFVACEDPLYLDHIHANEAGCLLAAETIAATLEAARVR
jgi:lysophospholipase L1-like esterase